MENLTDCCTNISDVSAVTSLAVLLCSDKGDCPTCRNKLISCWFFSMPNPQKSVVTPASVGQAAECTKCRPVPAEPANIWIVCTQLNTGAYGESFLPVHWEILTTLASPRGWDCTLSTVPVHSGYVISTESLSSDPY